MALQLQIVGNAMQMAVVQLQPGQTVYSEAGKFLFKTTNVSMDTRLSTPSNGQQGSMPGQQGGMGGLLRQAMGTAMQVGQRMLAGESAAFQYFTAQGGEGTLGFAGHIPGEMRALELDGSRAWLAEKDAFIAAESSVNFGIAFSGLRAGMRGGEGFVLEKFTGYGTVLIGGAGNFIDLELQDFGGALQVHTGCIVAFEEGISYSVERVGALNRQGMMNAVFGGDGLSLATLQGHGKVILQSMTLEGLANALRKAEGPDKDGPTGGLFSTRVE
ncbi:AIM24 family protein [Streptacidiphilus sp. PB12-B1b]|uniref:AIM24 family protein n=1 Tax=Streptacidiphilus sp. PB12-B1b TaxID=2705012 RepID=UPI0015FB111F|nr:AIM24 family protein [Streptacidiphilus sp. PB12-B1b]QMU79535.1 AIM24 family protein [Streptacidiphilus sp. PB12-B1b]